MLLRAHVFVLVSVPAGVSLPRGSCLAAGMVGTLVVVVVAVVGSVVVVFRFMSDMASRLSAVTPAQCKRTHREHTYASVPGEASSAQTHHHSLSLSLSLFVTHTRTCT